MLYLTDIPEEACIALVTKDWGDNSAGFLAMGFGEGPDNAIGYDCHFDKEWWESDEGDAYACVFDKTSYPVSVSQAALGCTCPNDLCTVVFTFQ